MLQFSVLDWNLTPRGREGSSSKHMYVCVEQDRVACNILELFGHMLVSRHHASLILVDAEEAII